MLLRAEGGKRKGLCFFVFLCTCCVAFSTLLFVDVFPVIVLSFGVATWVTTCLYLCCMVALVATFSRPCVATTEAIIIKLLMACYNTVPIEIHSYLLHLFIILSCV